MGWIGSVLLMVAGTGMGWYAAHRLRRRVVFLETCDRLLQTLWQEMSYTAKPMADLWRRLAHCEGLKEFALVRDTAEGLETVSFAAAFAAAVEKATVEGAILPPTRRLLIEFGEGCGRTDLEGQQTHIAYYRAQLSAQAEAARRVYAEKGRVYRVLGMTGGVALALLLM